MGNYGVQEVQGVLCKQSGRAESLLSVSDIIIYLIEESYFLSVSDIIVYLIEESCKEFFASKELLELHATPYIEN
ncbi:MAG: hypothetical protein HUK06_04355 [Bacteroidaceae bacterium]|nr:hypothetical protein [Bacteroidaceae bacterium]